MRKCILLLALTGGLQQPIISQVLTGRILTESGSHASAVSVRFQNGANSIVSNADGSFSIRASRLPDTLVFSAVGMEPYKVVITDKNIKDPTFEVVLLRQRAMLSEVIVSGYGSSRIKGITTGASTEYKAEEKEGEHLALAYDDAKPIYEKTSTAPLRIRGKSSVATIPGTLNGRSLFFRDSIIAPREGLLAKSGILTAGEVNDFYKWKMWEDFAANEFKSYSTAWGVSAVNRYSVQFTNKKLNALVNEPVYLVRRSTGDTLWKAVTDNTGKAELWANFLSGTAVEATDCYISDRFGNRVDHPSGFANGMNRLQADRACSLSDEADIAFVVDATGSMSDEIEFLKLELEDVIRRTQEKNANLAIRSAAVFYRDNRDEYVTKFSPFRDDMLKALNFIKLQSANGGGDFPEAVDAALATALDSLQWNSRARTRLLFLLLDAPPHAEAAKRVQEQIMQAAAMGIRLVPVACSGTDKSTEFLLRSMALATNGTYTFLTNHSGVGNPHIEPSTDKYEMELLNGLLQRVINQFLYTGNCDAASQQVLKEPVNRQPENLLGVKIYPNPTNGRFVIESKKELREIFITDFAGKILQKLGDPGKKGRWQVDIGQYPSGTYLVKYITTDNKWGAEKVLLLR